MNSNTEKNVRLVGAGLVPAHIKGKTQKGITLIALVITIMFSYDKLKKCSNSNSFLLLGI